MIHSSQPIDWGKILSITNQNSHLAHELLDMFAQELPDMKAQINQAYKTKEVDQLKHLIHKFHGSCRYCAVTSLIPLTEQIEDSLEKTAKPDGMTHLLDNLNYEMDYVGRIIQNKRYADDTHIHAEC